jgi:hypothetical protein
MPIDQEVYGQLRQSGEFDEMDRDTDEVGWGWVGLYAGEGR